jgi:hypothetical protein
MIGSFKLKLVGTFVALSLLPLAAAYWTFGGVADRSVTSTADARLGAGLRAAVAAYEDERRAAERAAQELAAEPAFQRALARGDRAALRRLVARAPRLRLEAGDLSVGTTPDRAAETTVALVGPGARSARIVAAIPFDDELVERLRATTCAVRSTCRSVVPRRRRSATSATASSASGSSPTSRCSSPR